PEPRDPRRPVPDPADALPGLHLAHRSRLRAPERSRHRVLTPRQAVASPPSSRSGIADRSRRPRRPRASSVHCGSRRVPDASAGFPARGGLHIDPNQTQGVSDMSLNHINLTVPDVPRSCVFFETYFGFRCVVERGRDALAVLTDPSGFVLTLSNFDKV